MKHNFAILLSVFILFSCTKDEDSLNNESESMVLKAAASTPGYIDQLANAQIPVHITFAPGVVTSEKMYLTARSDKNRACLQFKDDNSGRHKFRIRKTMIVNGVQYYEISALGGAYKGRNIVGDEPKAGYTEPVLWSPPPAGLGHWYFELNNQTNKYRIVGPNSGGRYMQAIKFNDAHLKMDKSISTSAYADWDITPCSDLEIESVSYYLTSSNGVVQKPNFIVETEVYNMSDLQQTMNVTFNSQATESSNFSKTEGISVNIATGFKVGVPAFESSLSTSITTSSTWTFGMSETKSDTRTYSFPITVPAKTNYKARATVSMYDANARYVARCRVKGLNQVILLEGNWTGIKAGTIKYEIFNINNVMVRSFTGTPTSPINMNK